MRIPEIVAGSLWSSGRSFSSCESKLDGSKVLFPGHFCSLSCCFQSWLKPTRCCDYLHSVFTPIPVAWAFSPRKPYGGNVSTLIKLTAWWRSTRTCGVGPTSCTIRPSFCILPHLLPSFLLYRYWDELHWLQEGTPWARIRACNILPALLFVRVICSSVCSAHFYYHLYKVHFFLHSMDTVAVKRPVHGVLPSSRIYFFLL